MKHFTAQRKSPVASKQSKVNTDQLIVDKKKTLESASAKSWNAKFRLWTAQAASVAMIVLITILSLSQADAQTTLYYTNFGTANGAAGSCYGNWNNAGWTFNTSVDAVITTLYNGSSGVANASPYVSTLPAGGASGGAYLGEGTKASGDPYESVNCNSETGTQAGVTTVFTLNVSTANFSNISLAFFYRISSNAYVPVAGGSDVSELDLSWSPDNINFTSVAISNSNLWDGNNGSMFNDGNWHPVSYTLPSGASNLANLYLRWTIVRTSATAGNFKLDDYTVSGTPIPFITLGAAQPAAGNISTGSNDNVVGGISLGITNNNASLTGVTVNTAGTYTAIDFTNFKFWLSSSATSIVGATQIGTTQSSVASGGAISVSGLNVTVDSSTSKNSYILVTGSVAATGTATAGHTIWLGSTAFNNLTFSSAELTGTNPVPGGTGAANAQTITNAVISPTKLVITGISSPGPFQNEAFTVTATAEDAGGTPRNVSTNTTVTLTKYAGTGTLSGTLTGTLMAGSDQIIFSNVLYNTAESGVEIEAAASGGVSLTAGISTAFTVFGVATHLVFSNVPSTGHQNVIVNSFTVQALRADNSVDIYYNSNIAISIATGAGTMSGTVSQLAVAGVATFNDIAFANTGNVAAIYTLNSNSGSLIQSTSSSIAITILTYPSPYLLSTGTYTFNNWSSNSPALTYPPNMIFHYLFTNGSDGTDVTSSSDTAIEDYYLNYELGSGTRIDGLGSGGVDFQNAAGTNDFEGGDLGEAILALNTAGQQNISVAWYDSTVFSNGGTSYHIKAQYRIGSTGGYTDLPHDSTPQIEYTSQSLNYGSMTHASFGPDTLPAICQDKPLVQLRWVYFQNGGSGTRDQISLDNIVVASVPGTPIIDTSNTSGFNGAFGTMTVGDTTPHSAINVNGLFLTSGITITPPVGFEVKLSTSSVYSTGSITIPLTVDSVTSTSIHVRFAPISAGAQSGNVVISSPGATSILVPVSGTGVCAVLPVQISGSTVYCAGGSTTINAGGGYGGGSNTYSWSNSAITQSIMVSSANTYSVTVTDVYGCTGTAFVNVTLGTNLNPVIAGSLSFCADSYTTLDAGPGYGSYLWTPGGATTETVQANSATTYSVTVMNGSCSGSASVAVTQLSLPIVGISGLNTICSGIHDTLFATGAVTYLWTTGSTTDSLRIHPSDDSTFTVIGTGSNGCTSTATFSVTVNPVPTVSVTPTSDVICSGSSVGLTASGTAISYSWSPSTGLSATTGASVTASPANNTTYIVTGMGSNGCTNTATSAITSIPAPPIPSTATTVTLCQGSIDTLTATPAPSNATLLWYTTPTGGTGSTTAPIPSTINIGTSYYYVSEEFSNAVQISVNGIITNGSPDEFSFLALSDIPAGTVIYFTNNLWEGTSFSGYTDSTISGSKDLVMFTAFHSISAGTVIQSYSSSSNYEWTATGYINPSHINYGSFHELSFTSSTGGMVFAFQSNVPTDPLGYVSNFLSAFDNTDGFVNATINGTGLSLSAGTAVTMYPEFRIYLTNDGGTRSASQWYQYIADTSNYTKTNGNSNTLPTASFNVATQCVQESPRVQIEVDVLSSPSPGVVSNTTLPICPAPGTIDLTVDPNGFYGDEPYSWTGPNGFTSNNQEIVIAGATSVNAGNYTATVIESDDGCSASQTLYVQVGCFTTVNINMFIQGYYLGGGQMQTVLSNEGIDPNPNPTNVDTVTVSLVDSVLLSNDPDDNAMLEDTVATAQGLLQMNGSLSVNFPGSVTGLNYYLMITHRNLVQSWSANTVTITNGMTYDFTSDPNATYGANVIDVYGEGIYSFYNGDILQNGYLGVGDVSLVNNDNLAGLSGGYYVTDVLGNGYLGVGDVSLVNNNNLAGIFSIHP